MTQSIEFFYDFRSPYSYMALTQLRKMDVDIALRPINVLKVMDLVGNVPTTVTCKAKGKYARHDLARWGQRYGVPLNPTNIPLNDREACLRAVLAAQSPADAAVITLAVYRAIWSESKTLASTDDILALIAATGIDPAPIAERIDAPDIVAMLEANTTEAARRGVFGSPTIFVGDAMFFGNDRLDFVREELARLEETV